MAGAPKGNLNAAKGRRWSQAIDKALKQYAEGDIKRGQALDAIALRLVDKAINGDTNEFKESMKEIGDRLDGKATQHIDANASIVLINDR